MKKDIRDFVFPEVNGRDDGGVFLVPSMDCDFTVLIGESERVCWHKDEPYCVGGNTYIEFNQTVAKVFDANTWKVAGYVVLSKQEGNAMPKPLYCFHLHDQKAVYTRIPLTSEKYKFYLNGQKYSLASNGVMVEAQLKQKSNFFKYESSSFTPAVEEVGIGYLRQR